MELNLIKNDINQFFENKTFNSNFTIDVIFLHIDDNNKVVTDLHTKLFSSFLEHFKVAIQNNTKVHGDINLTFSSGLNNVDVTIIGLICLFKDEFRNINFVIELPPDTSAEVFSRFRDTLVGLRNWFYSLSGISIFTIKNEELFNKDIINEPEGILPIFLVTTESFNNFFIKSNFHLELVDLIEEEFREGFILEIKHQASLTYATYDTFANKNYKIVRNTLRKFSQKINWSNNHRIIFQHYLRILSEFDLLAEQTDAIQGNDPIIHLKKSTKKGLNQSEQIKFKRSVKEILARLKEYPPFFTLIFSILTYRTLQKKIRNLNEYLKRLNDIFEFSRNLFLGLREIARNIIEHTESKKGVIVGRIYDGVTLKKVKYSYNSEKSISDYYKYLHDENVISTNTSNEYFFDIAIFDNGKSGIINKTIDNIENLTKSSKDNSLYLKDLVLLQNGEITFSDFYNPNEIKLNHHAIKASSHWGLIIFTNLINKNYGYFLASSYGKHTNFDCCYKYGNSISTINETHPLITGSYYNVILPLDKNFGLNEGFIANTVPKEPSFSEENFRELLKYKYVSTIDDLSDYGVYNLLKVSVREFLNTIDISKYRFEYELAEHIAGYLKLTKPEQRKFIPVLDFDKCEDLIDQSKLIRLLAKLELCIDIHSIITVNLKQELIDDLFTTLSFSLPKHTSHILNKSFWNKEYFILLYSYMCNSSNYRLYFANLLGGNTFNDFLLLNRKLSTTHFTYKRNVHEVDNTQLSNETKTGLRLSPICISDSGVVQNFEMIIEHDGKTLFEYSIEYILNEEI